jgi:hypothetical protein
MTATVQILPTLEALPGQGRPVFGLTLAAALEGDRPNWQAAGPLPDLLRALLRPWSWDGGANGQVTVKLVGVDLFALTAGGLSKQAALAAAPLELEARWSAFNWQPFRSRLDNRFEAFRRQEKEKDHPWGRGDRQRPVDPRMRPWPTFLADVSLLPRPIPQQLGLALRWVGPQLAPGSRVAAAPVLRIGFGAQPFDLKPAPAPAPSPADPSKKDPCFEVARFQYPTIPGLDFALVAETALIAADGVATDPCAIYLDLKRLWVRPKPGALSGTDWRAGMEERLAQAVDEARLTIDAIRLTEPTAEESQRIAAGGPRQAACGEAVARAALVALDAMRRLSCPGEPRREGPAPCQPPESFLLRALRWLERALPQPDVLGADRGAAWALGAGAWLNDHVARCIADPKAAREPRRQWASCLSQVLRPPADGGAAVAASGDLKALPILAALDDLNDPLQSVALLSADQVLAELDTIYAAVTTPASARSLLVVLWRLAMANAADWPGPLGRPPAKLADLITKLPDQVDVARELARDRAARNRPWLLDELRLPERGDEPGEPKQESFTKQKAFAKLAAKAERAASEQAVARHQRAVDRGSWSALGPEPQGARKAAGMLQAKAVERAAGGLHNLRAQVLDHAVRRVVLPELETVQDPLARGISLQVDTVDEDPEQRTLDGRCQDLLRHLQGIVMFVRFKDRAEDGWSGWFCLNYAAADLGDGPPQEVLVPARIGYQGGLRAPVLTYDGEPLTVGGPLVHRAVSGVSLAPAEPGAAPGAGELDTPLIELSYHGKATMPGLAYGRMFQTAACIVSNSGGLAPELQGLAPGAQALPIPEEWTSAVFHYRRCTPVGALGDDLGSHRAPPPDPKAPHCPVEPEKRLVPDGFAPRCQEIALDALLDPDDPILQPRRGATEAQPEFPLRVALLVPEKIADPAQNGAFQALEFQLTLPTVPLKVWERWIGYAAEEKPRLKFVRRSYEQRRQEHERCGDPCTPLEKHGIYLTDPAVEGIVLRLVELVEAGAGGRRVVVDECYEKLNRRQRLPPDYANADPADSRSLAHEQREPIRVKVSPRDSGGVVVTVNDATRLESNGEGEGVYRLTAYAVLAPGADARFGVPSTDGFSFERPSEVVCTANGRCLTSPWHLLVEVAEELPRDEEVADALWQALTVSTESAQGILDVRLDLLRPGTAPAGCLHRLRRHAYKADLHQQSWEWQGRPPARHPDLPPAEKCLPAERASRLLAFEMSEYGTRGDEDARSRPMARLGPLPNQGMAATKGQGEIRLGTWPDVRFGFREDLNTLQPTPDGRALHHRFGVRVFSRYAGVLKADNAFVDSRCSSDGLKWRNAWVPSRPLVALTRPDVRLVLPLTSGDPAGVAPSGGLLVVCGPGWYEQGGLAEELEIEVVDILAPDMAEGDCAGDRTPEQLARCERYFQVGTDPLVHRRGAAEELGLPATGRWRALSTRDVSVRFDGIVGGIGHHRGKPPYPSRFDLTSFLVPPPTLRSLANGDQVEKDLSWWFFKVQCRRRLLLDGDRSGVTARSEPAAPHWVQLLPLVQRVEKEWFEAADAGERPVLRGSRLFPGPAAGAGAARERFELVALMTERVYDAAGHRGQEAFLGLWWRSGNAWVTDQAALDRARQVVAGGRTEGLVVRWLEVQSRKEPLELKEGGDLWRRLFDLDIPDQDRARIVRMSRPHRVAVEGN